jgi:hypothetical protein
MVVGPSSQSATVDSWVTVRVVSDAVVVVVAVWASADLAPRARVARRNAERRTMLLIN